MRIALVVPGPVARAVLLIALVSTGCASGLKRPVQEVTAASDPQGVQRVTLDAHTFYFEPNRIVVKAGHPVEITIHNRAMMVPHNFTLKAPDGGLDVEKDVRWFGGHGVVRFTPDKPGEYQFYCDKDSHMRKGMKGTLVVQP
jgi:plastocyanin